MKEKKDCKIVQDLLPNYIEKLTNEGTNKYIEEHLKECNDCKKISENMQKELKIDTQKRDKREIKYIKKFSNKMRLLKAIIIIILIIFVIITGRKMFIISDLSNKAENTIKSTNYHKISYSYNMGEYTKVEIFNLEDKKKIILTQITDEEKKIRTVFASKIREEEAFDKYLANTYIETENSKTAELNKEIGISVDPQNTLYTENFWQLFICSIPASIKKTTFNGNECYYLSNFEGFYMSCSEGMYIDKKNGLPISTIAYEYEIDGTRGRWPATEYIYEFGTVKEEDFAEPDISEYEVK